MRVMRVAASFTASFIGWCAMMASYCVWMGYFTRSGRVSDWNFFLFWPGIVVFAAWLIIGAPLTQVRLLQRVEGNPLIVTALGALVGALAYAILVLTWAPVLVFIIFAVIVGAVAGLLYSLLIRFRVSSGLCLLTCPMILAVWLFVLLPSLTRLVPEFVYRVSAGQRQAFALKQILRKIPIGTSWEEVHRRYSMLGMSGSGFNFDYTIHLDSSKRVTRVEVRPRPQ